MSNNVLAGLCVSTATIVAAMASGAATSCAETPRQPSTAESYEFRVRAEVSYRCYGGYGKQKAVDSRTKVVCDNQEKKKTLFDEKIRIEMIDEPDPEDSRDIVGSWQRDVPFEGRTFASAVTLFKQVDVKSEQPYRLRAVAYDDEPVTRRSSTFLDMKELRTAPTITVEMNSANQPEEIEYTFTVEPVR